MLRTRTSVALISLCFAAAAQAQTKPPIAQYWMDVATNNSSLPGMGGMGGIAAGLLGGGGMGAGGQRTLNLSLYSARKNNAPEAAHDIPPAQNMGPALPLVIPAVERASGGTERDTPGSFEQPRARMLVYWGCGDAVRTGQPRVADTQSMTPQQFGQAFAGRTPPDRGNPFAAGRALWPNQKDSKPVPASSSLQGDHLVRGNYTPDIPFKIGSMQDFMEPVSLAASGQPADAIQLEWKAIPTAQGYFLMAMGQREKTNETIIWTSSEVQESGWGLMNYLPNDFLRRMIQEKVVLPSSVTRCTIPKGIFDGADGAMTQMIAYGEELNLVHPPRPADPKAAWEPIWSVKVRVKSTGMTILGMADRGAPASRADGPATTESAPAPERGSEAPVDPVQDAVKGGVNKLRGLFGL